MEHTIRWALFHEKEETGFLGAHLFSVAGVLVVVVVVVVYATVSE